MTTVADLPEIDFAAPDYVSAPLATLAEFARRSNLGRSVRGIEIFDYDMCRDTILSRSFGTGHPRLMQVLGLPEGPAMDYKRNSISFHNRGEMRRRLRVPITKLLGPEGSERFRTDIRHVVKSTIAEIPTGQDVDLIHWLCDRIPSRVYCYWINAPMTDAEFVSRTSHIVQQVHTRDPQHSRDITDGFEDLLEYADRRIEIERKTMGDNLLADLIRACDAGHLSKDDLRNWVVKIAEANTDNSSHQIAIAVIELASRPGLWARLGRDPDLVPQALREVMRYHPRSLSTSREALEDTTLDGVHILKGTTVFPNIGAAHWNPKYFPNPEKFDITRPDNPSHLNFGGGIFSCIGRFAVTIEIEETIALLAASFPEIRLAEATFSHSPMFTSVTGLRAVLNGR